VTRSRGKHAAPSLEFLLARANRQVSQRLESILQSEGLTIEQFRVLDLLAEGEGYATGEVAQAVMLSLPSATRVLDKMVNGALIYRAPDARDRRKVLIFVSDRGLQVLDQLRANVRLHEREIAELFGGRETERLVSMLERLVTRISV